MKYFSTFSGIGGFEKGIEQAYEHNNQQTATIEQDRERGNGSTDLKQALLHDRSESPLCIGFSEIDKYATQIYQSHFPEHKNYGDITKINTDDLPDFDLLIGGFPCQSFSIAGKRKGFEDTRGTMFFELARILRAKQPRLFVFENVKGLLSHDNGDTFKTIISAIDELGYDCQWQVLNSKNHGVPQNRERVFIIGHLRGTSRPEVFPFTESNAARLTEITSGADEASRVYNALGVSRTIKNGGGMGAKTGLYQCLKCNGENKTEHGLYCSGIRRLTPTECERLQGFPYGWTEGVSDTQRYKTLGNAVTVNVIKDIMERLLEQKQ